jgi:formamidopyrimidine-DNA glycosylase
MPELPEVQTTVNGINRTIIGLKVTDVWTDWKKAFKSGSFEKFKKDVIGRKFVKARRRAKFIILDLSGGKSILMHQRMSGHLLYGKWEEEKKSKWVGVSPKHVADDPKNRFIRHIFFLSNGKMLAFSDLRRFGTIALHNTKDLENVKELKVLGPEPLDKSFTFKKFKELSSKKKGKIKPLLMDPTFVVGIGNIYSDEILWYAGIHPLRAASDLKDKELKNLYKSIISVLKKGLKHRGTSVDDYRDLTGDKGNYQNITKAYHRTGEKCSKKDGGTIRRMKVGGRSAHFCNKHQK